MNTTTINRPAAAAPKRGERQILTPEGVPLIFRLGELGERASAFLIDLVFLTLAIIGLVLGLLLLGWIGVPIALAGGWGIAMLVVIIFLMRTLYFAFFELRWRGATPGKRIMKLKVIDRAGGPLRADAVMVRNLMREVEVFLPLTLILSGTAGTSADQMTELAMLGWTGIFTLFPLFNRDRLRLGDLVAGTCVIATPRAMLLRDLSETSPRATRTAAAQPPRYAFTQQQLDVYGTMELQTLEDVLRRTDIHAAETRRESAKRIRKRIAWEDPAGPNATDFNANAFLEAFYAAQRGRLEKNMLFGIHRRDKNDRAAGRNGKS